MAGSDSSELTVLTGGDRQFFWQLLLLDESLRRNSPRTRLMVCDFGLTDAQRRYLRSREVLLEMPPEVAAGKIHPWYYKAMLSRYVKPLGSPAILWLDMDLVILADLDRAARQLDAEMSRSGAVIAASGRAAATVGAWLRDNPRASGFREKAACLDPGLPYLSSGIFLCRAASLLEDWNASCRALPYELLFEQNAFNLAAWSDPDLVHLLDPDLWNLSGSEVARTSCVLDETGVVLRSPAGQVHVLHATSTNRLADLLNVHMEVTINGAPRSVSYRIVQHPDPLRKYQDELFLDGLRRELPALLAAGCFEQMDSQGEP